MEDAAKSEIIFFLWKEKNGGADIARRLHAVFGDLAESVRTVDRWIERFKGGRQSLQDERRSGRPATAVNDENVVEAILMEDRRVTIREIFEQRQVYESKSTKFCTSIFK